MISRIPRISVLLICYEQENVIRRAINSLLSQRNFIYEICISDDKSSDGTWSIVLNYKREYPELFKIHQNDSNVGIFRNIEQTLSMPSGDLIYQLSGDDECGYGYFEQVVRYIKENKIDYSNEAICIYGDYKQVNPEGVAIIYKNDLVERSNALKLKIRQLISNRSACFSRLVLNRFFDIAEGRSYIVELTQDAELQIFSDKNYYLPKLGNVYYAGIGVSHHFTSKEVEENNKVYDHFLSFCSRHQIIIGKRDLYYIEFMKCYRAKKIIRAFKYYMLSLDLSLGIRGLQLERINFVLRSRLLK